MRKLRILVVEDEPLVALLHEDLIAQAGHLAVSLPQNHADAVTAADREQFDVAIVDAEIWGHDAAEVLEALRRRNKPFIVCSGYPEGDLPQNLRGHPVLGKPYALSDLRSTLGEFAAA